MKPRLKKVGGLWVCRDRNDFDFYGLGYTPAQAYADWLAIGKKKALGCEDDWR